MEIFDRRICKLSVLSSFAQNSPHAPASYQADKLQLVPGTPGGPLDPTSVREGGEKTSLTYEYPHFCRPCVR